MISEASDWIVIAVGGMLIQTGILLATVRFINEKLTTFQSEMRGDINGIGRKDRAIMAELIIQAAGTSAPADFATIVRKLINGI